ncbi:hypothetical protein [Pseudomonas sp. VD9]|uniref:hypothetical protein n=1 Tax=Pseudomonas sp. VD9 TaxID=3342076 RepID=UPI003C6CBC17
MLALSEQRRNARDRLVGENIGEMLLRRSADDDLVVNELGYRCDDRGNIGIDMQVRVKLLQ